MISIRSNDPGSNFEAGGTVGYEGVAREFRGEGYISGPLTESLGARLAVYGSTMKGWVRNLAPDNGVFTPESRRSPNADEWAFRGTLKFDDGGPFDARLKVAYNHVSDDGMTSNYQVINCPNGNVSQTSATVDCRGDDRITQPELGPVFGQITTPVAPTGLPWSTFGDGTTFSNTKQWLAGLEMNYALDPTLKLTSVTGYYDLSFLNASNFTDTDNLSAILGSANNLHLKEWSQEIRLASSFSGPINFLVGADYHNSKGDTASAAAAGGVAGQPSIFGPTRLSPFVVSDYYFQQSGSAWSVFGQLQIKPVPELELSAGGRYSREKKKLESVEFRGAQLIGVSPALSNGLNAGSWSNFSPEITLSYRPNRDLNVYATYKHGFLSGGFNTGSPSPTATSYSYSPEKVKGFEAGVKGRFFDGLLDVDLAAYTYKIDDLQVQITISAVQLLQNAGKVSSKGAELGLTLHPSKSLSIYGNLAYQHGRYDEYFANCYAGQTTFRPGTGIGQCGAQTTPNDPDPTHLYQNLAGTELIRSPEWSGNAGINYQVPFGDDLKLDLSPNLTFSNGYVASALSQPYSRSPGFVLLNASVRLAQKDDRWSIDFIGNNLTNKFYWLRTTDATWSSGFPGQLADQTAVVNRGRELWVRVGFKY